MSPCIIFPKKARTNGGYGVVGRAGRFWLAHRLAWTEAHGPIPPGMFVCHRCDNPACINVEHLFLGTPKDNTQDMLSKGRARGQKITHCPRGHRYTPENTYRIPTTGGRMCRACHRLRHPLSTRARVTHCPRGHEYTPENTRIYIRDYKTCVTCRRERAPRAS